MDLGLAGKTVIVTGGSSNIGRAISLAFAQEGSNVVIAARHVEDCRKVAGIANTSGSGRAIAVRADVTKFDDVEAMVKKTLDEFKKIDVLVNNVGWGKLGLFTELDRKWWDPIIAVNFIQILNCFKVVLPLMIEQKSGSIVSTSSVRGRIGGATEPIYAALKAGVINFSKSIAQQVARDGIRVNIVAPGLVVPTGPETVGGGSVWKLGPTGFTMEEQKILMERVDHMVPMGKPGKPTDVAYAVLFLASDITAGHITGHIIGVDGGTYMGW